MYNRIKIKISRKKLCMISIQKKSKYYKTLLRRDEGFLRHSLLGHLILSLLPRPIWVGFCPLPGHHHLSWNMKQINSKCLLIRNSGKYITCTLYLQNNLFHCYYLHNTSSRGNWGSGSLICPMSPKSKI